MHPTEDTVHDLREGAALALGWLETVFRNWDRFDDVERREMIAAALYGAHEIAAALERMEGREPKEVRLPADRMADDFLRLVEEEEAAS